MITQVREDLAKKQIQEFMERMNKMGYDGEEIVTLLQKTMKEGEK